MAPNYFTPQQDALLKKLQTVADKLNDAGQGDKADQVQKSIDDTKDAVRSKWRATKDQYLEVCNQKMVGKYVTAALIARKYNVKDASVQNAVSRLAFFTDYLGDDKMKPYVENTPDPSDPNSKLVYRERRVLAVALGRRVDTPGQRRPGASAGRAVMGAQENTTIMRRRFTATLSLLLPALRMGGCLRRQHAPRAVADRCRDDRGRRDPRGQRAGPAGGHRERARLG